MKTNENISKPLTGVDGVVGVFTEKVYFSALTTKYLTKCVRTPFGQLEMDGNQKSTNNLWMRIEMLFQLNEQYIQMYYNFGFKFIRICIGIIWIWFFHKTFLLLEFLYFSYCILYSILLVLFIILQIGTFRNKDTLRISIPYSLQRSKFIFQIIGKKVLQDGFTNNKFLDTVDKERRA